MVIANLARDGLPKMQYVSLLRYVQSKDMKESGALVSLEVYANGEVIHMARDHWRGLYCMGASLGGDINRGVRG